MPIDYNLKKRPTIIYISILTALIVPIMLAFEKYVLFIPLIIIALICWFMREFLIFEYRFLKWFESQIKRASKDSDSNFFHNQKILFHWGENRQISFKKMGYYSEEELWRIGVRLNDFFDNHELSKIIYEQRYIKILYTPHRQRLFLKRDQILDPIFLFEDKIKLDSQLSISGMPNHMIISGKTGSGKSYFCQNYLYPNLNYYGNLHIVDVKNTTPDTYRTSEYDFTNNSVRGLEILRELNQLMMDKYANKQLGDKPHYLIFEEVVAFKLNLTKEEKIEFETLLKKILVLGREAKIFIIFISQAVNIGKDGVFDSVATRDQFSIKINFGEISQEQSQQLFGIVKKDLPKMRDFSKGSGYLKFDSEIYSYQAPVIED